MNPPVIALHGVSKSYGTVHAVDKVSLQVHAGEVYALLGLNGAGKTTLIRLLLGMVRPTTGTIEVLGRPLSDRSVWSQVGYLVESPSAYPELSVRENLEVVRRLRKLDKTTQVEDAIELFGLGRYADRRARTLSLGNSQRLALAKAMLHRPSLVVLDEPVNGLDPAGVVEVRELLAELAHEHHMTVFLSSHILGEVARLATRIGVLHEGRLIDEFTASSLNERMHRHLEVVTRDNVRALEVLGSAGVAARAFKSMIVLEDPWATDNPEAVATALVNGGAPPTRLGVVEEDLESYFLRLVGRAAHAEVSRVR